MEISTHLQAPQRQRPSILRLFRLASFCCLLLLLCAGCGDSTQPSQTTTEPVQKVNGFGGTNNHVHSLLALPGKVLLLASHYGLFRSTDDGASWMMVAAGPGQLMDGLMTDSLVVSPFNNQRIYVLTQPALSNPKGTLGLYTSADGGKNWTLATSQEQIGNIYFVRPGNDTADEAYIYVPSLGPLGLKVSMDNGKHFTDTAKLPFGRLLDLRAIPGAPGHLLIGSNDGMARSTDGGIHWEMIKGINGAVYSIATAGPRDPIYAAGDDGIYVSKDGGKSFALVYSQSTYGSLTVSPKQSNVVYGKTGRAVYRSTDSAKTWQALPGVKKGQTQSNLGNLAPDPTNANLLYLSLSYPTEVHRFDSGEGTWTSLTPKV